MSSEFPELLTISQVAKILQVSQMRAYELVRLRMLPACKLGRQVRVDKARLLEWIARGGMELPGGWKN